MPDVTGGGRRRWFSLVAALAAFACVPAVGGCVVEAVPSSADTGHISGLVASSKTARGVPNILVALVRDDEIVDAVATDDLGEFRFRGVDRGSYVVQLTGLELSGLNPLHTTLEPVRQAVRVGEDPVELTFAVVGLLPSRIVGEVRCGGRPVVGARIHVVGGVADMVVETDPVGRYGATDLTPGSYTVMAMDVPCAVETELQIVSLKTTQSVVVDFEG
jgi:hypothetical protein